MRPIRRTIASGYNTNIPQYCPVKLNSGVIEAAAAADRAIGTFMGCEYTESTGMRRVSNLWPANTVATDIWAWVMEDPGIFYQIQANAAVAEANIGDQYNWANPTTFDVGINLSKAVLDVASSAANNGLQLYGLVESADNAWGDAFPVVIVRLSEHQFVADVAAF